MKKLNSDLSKLNALILIGGQSKRMGSDKSTLNYHGKEQWKHLVDILQSQVDRVYISIRSDQLIDYPHLITDQEAGLGPFGAILSALEKKPNEAFLVLATDLPFIDKEIIRLLIKQRDKTKIATALQAKNKTYPEALACIWEAQAIYTLHDFYKQRVYKPIQVLKQNEIKRIVVNDNIVENINTLLEFTKAKKRMEKKNKQKFC